MIMSNSILLCMAAGDSVTEKRIFVWPVFASVRGNWKVSRRPCTMGHDIVDLSRE